MNRTLINEVEHALHDAMMSEVSTTPKPGLVDRLDSGAHQDMDYQTFTSSAAAITPYLGMMFEAGLLWPSEQTTDKLFEHLRQIGIQAEQAMFTATNGINTHKGMIFSLGTIAAAAGFYYQKEKRFSPPDILLLAGKLCAPAMVRDLAAIDQSKPKTHGELLYVKYGYQGIRGEAADGFPAVRTISYPYLSARMAGCFDTNSVNINTLFHLMAKMDDTNVLIRTGPEMLSYMQNEARRFLADGGAFDTCAAARLPLMNRDFIEKNISPGGCADLLAVTIFLWNLEQNFNSNR